MSWCSQITADSINVKRLNCIRGSQVVTKNHYLRNRIINSMAQTTFSFCKSITSSKIIPHIFYFSDSSLSYLHLTLSRTQIKITESTNKSIDSISWKPVIHFCWIFSTISSGRALDGHSFKWALVHREIQIFVKHLYVFSFSIEMEYIYCQIFYLKIFQRELYRYILVAQVQISPVKESSLLLLPNLVAGELIVLEKQAPLCQTV